jgi:hypothetical protein
MRLQRLLVVLAVSGSLGACLPEPAPMPGATLTPGAGLFPSPSITPSGQAGVSNPSTPAACPVPPGSPVPPDLNDPGQAPAALLEYFNGGGEPAGLVAQLTSAGLISGQGDPLLTLDLDGNSWLDLVIVLPDPVGAPGVSRLAAAFLRPAPQTGRRGSVVVLLCRVGHYTSASPAILVEPDGLPILHDVAQLTGDTSADLLLGWATCGAHTCFERFEVLSASDAQLLRHALDRSDDLPYPEIGRAAGGRVEITATGIASAGAGPFRKLTRTWEWDPAEQGFRPISEQLEPPRYRIHVMLDAEASARAGDLRQALDLYHRVALDESLLDWVDPATEQANLIGYSMFQVVLTYVRMHDTGDASKAYGILQNQYPAGTVGHAYAAMAQAFWETYTATDDPELGCQAARAFADVHADEIITPLYFGYANPVHTPADICPGEDR